MPSLSAPIRAVQDLAILATQDLVKAMVFKQNLTPLSKNGAIHKHKGKGSAQAPLPDRNTLRQLPKNPSPQNYAKATPMPSGQTSPMDTSMGIPGLGSGTWAGNGM